MSARATGQPDLPMGRDGAEYANQRTAVVLERAFLNQALIDVIEFGLGRKTVPILKLRPKLRKVVDQKTGVESKPPLSPTAADPEKRTSGHR